MKLPWVSRELHETQVAYLREEAHAANTRFDALLEKYFAVTLQSMTPPEAPLRTPDDLPVKRERSVVSQTIKEEANGNPKVAAWLQKRARELRAENKSPDEIATELRRWQSTEDVKE